MTAMPQNGSGGGRRRGMDGGPLRGADVGVIFERLDNNERAIEAMTAQVSQVATQVASLAGTAQVLANTDATFKQQADAQSIQIQQLQQWRYDIIQQIGELRASIKQTITDALRDTQTVERRADDSQLTAARLSQRYLIMVILAIVGPLLSAFLTYIVTHH